MRTIRLPFFGIHQAWAADGRLRRDARKLESPLLVCDLHTVPSAKDPSLGERTKSVGVLEGSTRPRLFTT